MLQFFCSTVDGHLDSFHILEMRENEYGGICWEFTIEIQA